MNLKSKEFLENYIKLNQAGYNPQSVLSSINENSAILFEEHGSPADVKSYSEGILEIFQVWFDFSLNDL